MAGQWLGHWLPEIHYVKGDGVEFGGDGYVCVEDHLSFEDNQPGASEYWVTATTEDIKNLEVEDSLGIQATGRPEVALPDCEVHTFIFLRTAKTKSKNRSEEGDKNLNHWHRMDTFYCQHCLRYSTMERNEDAPAMPAWYKDG
jgi:hypothetical protein